LARILLAEDDESMRRFLAGALMRAGHDVISCADGEEALVKLKESGFDVLLSDIVMPGMDGIELARQAAEQAPKLRIMFITGFAAVALNEGEDATRRARVLSKPVHLRELVREIERLMVV
jgi:two-component system cell cycle response regulator CpdR